MRRCPIILIIVILLLAVVSITPMASASNTGTEDCSFSDSTAVVSYSDEKVTLHLEKCSQETTSISFPGNEDTDVLSYTNLKTQHGGYYMPENVSSATITYTMGNNSTEYYTLKDDWAYTYLPNLVGAHDKIQVREEEGLVFDGVVFFGEYEMYKKGKLQLAVYKPVDNQSNFSGRSLMLSLYKIHKELGDTYDDSYRLLVIPQINGSAGYYFPLRDHAIIECDETSGYHNIVAIHELIHYHQKFFTKEEMDWFKEASAEYLSYKYGVKFGYTTPKERNEATYVPPDGSVLTNKSTWSYTGVSYDRGARVLAALSEKNISTVGLISQFNQEDTGISYMKFNRSVHEETNQSMGVWLEEHINGTTEVDIWRTNQTVEEEQTKYDEELTQDPETIEKTTTTSTDNSYESEAQPSGLLIVIFLALGIVSLFIFSVTRW